MLPDRDPVEDRCMESTRSHAPFTLRSRSSKTSGLSSWRSLRSAERGGRSRIAIVRTHAPQDHPSPEERGLSRIPARSFLYRRVLPVLLAGMAVLTLILIGVALAVLLGWIPWT